MAEFHPDAPCTCGHPGRDHRPSAVAPFGRGMCLPRDCRCRYMVIAGIPTPRPRYQHQRGCPYGLVVHRGRQRRRCGEYQPPERAKIGRAS